jgi:hypothetical protein
MKVVNWPTPKKYCCIDSVTFAIPDLPYKCATRTKTLLGAMEEKLGGKEVVDQVIEMTFHLHTSYQADNVVRDIYRKWNGVEPGSGAAAQVVLTMFGHVQCPFTYQTWSLADAHALFYEPFAHIEEEILINTLHRVAYAEVVELIDKMIEGDEAMLRKIQEIKYKSMEEKSEECMINSRQANVANLEQVQLPNVHLTERQIEEEVQSRANDAHFYRFRVKQCYDVQTRKFERPPAAIAHFTMMIRGPSPSVSLPYDYERQCREAQFFDEDGNRDYGNLNFYDYRYRGVQFGSSICQSILKKEGEVNYVAEA